MRKVIPVLAIMLFSLSPLYFYRLGQSSLESFDEAWYASVAKNLLSGGNPFLLEFNGQRFSDHPPAGFWLMAVSQQILGSNEFASRLPSAVLGLLTLAVVFILGRDLRGDSVGFASAFALASSPWFVLRSRSGNLDVPLTFFLALTFLLAVKSSKNLRFLPLFSLSLGFLLLTKTMAPFTLFPSLLLLLANSAVPVSLAFSALFFGLVPFLIWVGFGMFDSRGFINRYFSIGNPQSGSAANYWQNLLLTKTYLHHGFGIWFRSAVVTLPLSLLTRSRIIFSLFLFLTVFLLPFLFSSRGQIWHLIPSYPFLFLVLFTTLHWFLSRVKIPPRWVTGLVILSSLVVSVPQIRRNWQEFIDIPAFISDQAILSQKAGAYPYPLFIEENFLPVAAFYSGKTVTWSNQLPDISALADPARNILLITHRWRLDKSSLSQDQYGILASDRDLVLLLITGSPANKNIQKPQ